MLSEFIFRIFNPKSIFSIVIFKKILKYYIVRCISLLFKCYVHSTFIFVAFKTKLIFSHGMKISLCGA